jgi:hypothetical protein
MRGQLHCEVVDEGFFHAHRGRPSSDPQGLDRLGARPFLPRERHVRKPLELLGPLPRHDKRRELGHAPRQHAVEAEVLAGFLQRREKTRTAQQRNERTFDALPRAGDQRVRRRALQVIHRFARQRWHTVVQ